MVRLFLAVGLLGLPAPPQAGVTASDPGSSLLTVEKSFHIVGIPGFHRHTRVDLVLTKTEIIFVKRKGRQDYRVPFSRLEKVVLFSGHRHYAKSAMAAAAASYGIGSLLMMKKRKVDTLVIDYRNERGGLMGIAVQLPAGKGEDCRQLLVSLGLEVEEPEAEK